MGKSRKRRKGFHIAPPVLCAGGAMALGLTVLLGWAADWPILTRFLSGWTAMQPLTAVSMAVGGAGLYAFIERRWRRVAIAVTFIAAIAASALVQYGIDRPLGIDTSLFPTAVLAQTNMSYPGRMTGVTAVEFLVFCLFLAWPRRNSRLYRLASRVATLGLLVAFISLAGYLLGAQGFASFGGRVSMAAPTALGFIFLFTGGLLAQGDPNWLHRLLGHSTGSRLARRLLYHIVGWPLLLGLMFPVLTVLIPSTELRFALYMVVLTVVLVMVVLKFAKRLDRAEARRLRAAASLDTMEAQLAGVLASTLDAVICINEAQRVVYFNPAAERVFLCPANEAIGAPIEQFIPERFRGSHADHVRGFAKTGVTRRSMGRLGALSALRQDGTEFPIEASISQVGAGGEKLFTVILRDITERRRAEELMRASEEKYRTLFTNMTEGFGLGEPILDGEGRPIDVRFLEVNDAFYEQTGISRGVEGRPLREILPHLEPSWVERYCAVSLTGVADRFDSYSADTQRYYDVYAFCPRPGRFAILFRDVTSRKRIQEALLDSEQRYRALFNNKTSAIAHHRVITDENGDPVDYFIEAINRTYEEIIGIRREAVEGRRVTEVFPGIKDLDFDPVEQLGRIGLEGGEGRFEMYFPPSQKWLAVYAYSPKPGEFTAIFTDISMQKDAEAAILRVNADLERRVAERTQELTQANEALLSSNEELQRFAYIASHDLQTPLRSIVGFSQILQKDYIGQLDERANDLLTRVVEASRHMHALIRDLLAYSRVDAQTRPFGSVDFNEVFENVVATLDGAIRESGAVVTHGELPKVVGDQGQLTQLLQNLMENGIKYHGQEPPRIHFWAERKMNDWLFSVQDNGIGIAPRHKEAIFEVFRRLHTRQAYPGTGIGLSVCRRVVERHGGHIWVDSEPGQGSVFHFTLPFVKETRNFGRRATDGLTSRKVVGG